MDETLRMMEDLTSALGVPGQEHEVREVMARYLAPLGEVVTDNLGSIVGVKTGRGVDSERAPRVLIAGHMDALAYRNGTLGARARERLRQSPEFDDLMLLRDLDTRGRQPGAVVCELSEALDYIRGLEQELESDG